MHRFEDWATADIVLIVESETLNELFSEAGMALENYMVSGISPKEEKRIELKGSDLKDLLYSWLNELIYLKDAEGFFFSKLNVVVEKNSQYVLKAVGYGERFDESRHESKHDVKSCTYHKLEIKKDDKWKAQVVLDI